MGYWIGVLDEQDLEFALDLEDCRLDEIFSEGSGDIRDMEEVRRCALAFLGGFGCSRRMDYNGVDFALRAKGDFVNF